MAHEFGVVVRNAAEAPFSYRLTERRKGMRPWILQMRPGPGQVIAPGAGGISHLPACDVAKGSDDLTQGQRLMPGEGIGLAMRSGLRGDGDDGARDILPRDGRHRSLAGRQKNVSGFDSRLEPMIEDEIGIQATSQDGRGNIAGRQSALRIPVDGRIVEWRVRIDIDDAHEDDAR